MNDPRFLLRCSESLLPSNQIGLPKDPVMAGLAAWSRGDADGFPALVIAAVVTLVGSPGGDVTDIVRRAIRPKNPYW